MKEITQKTILEEEKSSHGDDDDSYCQFTFKNYSELTNKNVKVTRREYEKAKEGDK